jgi:ADP-ribose pyrophosphatase
VSAQNPHPQQSAESLPNAPVVGVGAVVFNEGRVLLVKRRTPPSEGLWAIPGGRLMLGETLQQAAEREILEETGIIIQAHEPVFAFDVIERDERGAIRYHYVIVDVQATYVSGKPMAGDDAEIAAWLSPNDVRRLPVSEKTLYLLKEILHFL